MHECDVRVGGRYRFAMKHSGGNVHVAFGSYEQVTRPSRLVFTIAWEGNPDAGESRVTVSFEPRGEHTHLVFVQEQMPNVESRDRHLAGWTGCFEKLVQLF